MDDQVGFSGGLRVHICFIHYISNVMTFVVFSEMSITGRIVMKLGPDIQVPEVES